MENMIQTLHQSTFKGSTRGSGWTSNTANSGITLFLELQLLRKVYGSCRQEETSPISSAFISFFSQIDSLKEEPPLVIIRLYLRDKSKFVIFKILSSYSREYQNADKT